MREVTVREIRAVDVDGLSSFLLWPGELPVLVGLMRLVNPRRVAEIGVHRGETAMHLLKFIASIEEYIGIDVYPDYVTPLRVQRMEVPVDAGHMVVGDSRFKLMLRQQGSHDVKSGDLGGLDAIFIDGDHSSTGVAADTELAMGCVREGGIIIWHDYYSSLKNTVSDFLDERKSNNLFHVENTSIAFELQVTS